MGVKQSHKAPIWEWFITTGTTYKNCDLGDCLLWFIIVLTTLMIKEKHVDFEGMDIPLCSDTPDFLRATFVKASHEDVCVPASHLFSLFYFWPQEKSM